MLFPYNDIYITSIFILIARRMNGSIAPKRKRDDKRNEIQGARRFLSASRVHAPLSNLAAV